MSIRKVLTIVLVASGVMLAVGIGPRFAETAQALPPAQEPDPVGVTIPYPGRLNDEAGQPVADGAYDFTFALYDAETGGEPLWSEVQEGVAVGGGAFIASLGSANPIPKEVLDGSTGLTASGGARWLAVGVRGPGESDFTGLTPRQRLSVAAPAAPASPTNGMACPHDHFGETWTGTGLALALNSSYAGNETLYVTNNATSGDGIRAYSAGSAYNDAALKGSNTSSGSGVYGYSSSGDGVYGRGVNGNGVFGYASAGDRSGVYGYNAGSGYGVYAFSYSGVGLKIQNQVSNNLIEAWHGPLFSDREFYVSGVGEVYADGSFHSGGADFAEMLPAIDGLEPGDVLVVGSDGKLTRSTQSYQASVVGVYSTQPGFVGGAGDDTDLTGKIPLTVIGVVPMKVTAENGPIHPGDLLVASSTPGHAMRADPNPPVGTVIGKALEGLDESTGVIQMLVMLQ